MADSGRTVFGGGAGAATRQLYGPFPFTYQTPDLFQPAPGAVMTTLPAGAIIETAWIEGTADGWNDGTSAQGMEVLADIAFPGGASSIVDYEFAVNASEVQDGINYNSEIANPTQRRQNRRLLRDTDILVDVWGDGSTPTSGAANLFILVTIPA